MPERYVDPDSCKEFFYRLGYLQSEQQRYDWREMQKMEDGEICIDRDALVEPEIHQKIKRVPSGRKKLIVKRIPRDYSLSIMLETGQVIIKNASGTWMKSPDGIDLMACKMLFKFFREYQETGVIQEHIGYFANHSVYTVNIFDDIIITYMKKQMSR